MIAYAAVVRWKNYLLQGTKAVTRLTRPGSQVSLVPRVFLEPLWTVAGEMEETLAAHPLREIPVEAHLMSAATCFAHAGAKDRARSLLTRAHAQSKVDAETLAWFKRMGVTLDDAAQAVS